MTARVPGLRATEIATHALAIGRTPRPFPWIPQGLWWLADPLITCGPLWLARGMMPPGPRARQGRRRIAESARTRVG